jgi:hypothetical protein
MYGGGALRLNRDWPKQPLDGECKQTVFKTSTAIPQLLNIAYKTRDALEAVCISLRIKILNSSSAKPQSIAHKRKHVFPIRRVLLAGPFARFPPSNLFLTCEDVESDAITNLSPSTWKLPKKTDIRTGCWERTITAKDQSHS